jgi:hypothetical protein
MKQLDKIEKDARSNMELETEKAKYHYKNGDKKYTAILKS